MWIVYFIIFATLRLKRLKKDFRGNFFGDVLKMKFNN